MSSTMTTESHQDPGNRPTGSDSSLAVTEDVLRAAALRSLKEKRKKQQTVSSEFPSLPSRPAVSDPSSIQLDYGQADSPSSIASSSAPLPTATKADVKMDVDDAAREEGEISDSEEPPAPTPPSPVATKQPLKKSPPPQAKPRTASPKLPERKKAPTPPLPTISLPVPSSAVAEAPRPPIPEPSTAQASKTTTDMPPPPLPTHYNPPVVDPYQARPGLNSKSVVCYF